MNASEEILFASTRNDQTDILMYNVKSKKKKWITDTKGSEYSPVKFGSSEFILIVRLDKNGDQFLYKYELNNGKVEILIHDLVIGYYEWVNNNTILSFVLGNPPTLQSSDLNYKVNKVLDKNIGRSIKRIPNTDLMSFISKNGLYW